MADEANGVGPPIAANLRRLKIRAGVTWQHVATAADVQLRHVHQWANPEGRFNPSWPKLELLAKFFSEQLGETIRPGDFYRQEDSDV